MPFNLNRDIYTQTQCTRTKNCTNSLTKQKKENKRAATKQKSHIAIRVKQNLLFNSQNALIDLYYIIEIRYPCSFKMFANRILCSYLEMKKMSQ